MQSLVLRRDKEREIQALKSFETSHRAGMLFLKGGKKSANAYVFAYVPEKSRLGSPETAPTQEQQKPVSEVKGQEAEN